MPRIRTVKPEFWSSPDTASCADPWARLLYIAMWNWADDHGRGTANVKELAGFAFPNDEKLDASDVRRMLGEISQAFGVLLYKVAGRPYYSIPSWTAHQKLDKRSERSRWPGPEEGDPWDPGPEGGDKAGTRRGQGGNGVVTARITAAEINDHAAEEAPSKGPLPSKVDVSSDTRSADTGPDLRKLENQAGPALSPPETRRDPGVGTGEQGNRGTEEERTSSTAARIEGDRAPGPDPFEEFWKAYPRRVEKRAAQRAWKAALNRKVSPELIIAAAKAYAGTARRSEPRFVKHPAAWLNAGAYDDHSPTSGVIPVDEIPDDAIDPDEILGPDYWQPTDCPEGIEFGPPDQRREWYRKRQETHRAERITEARGRLKRRRGTA